VTLSYPTGQGTNATIWIDDVQVSADANSWLPLSYQVGGTARTAEVVDLSMISTGTAWSQRLLWRPGGPGWASIGVDLPLSAFGDAGGNHVELYWHAADQKIYAAVNGSAGIAGPVVKWHQHDCIRLLYVSPTAGDAVLYTSDPVNGIVATTITGGALPHANLCRLGSNWAGTSFGLGHFADLVLFRTVFSTAAWALAQTPLGVDHP
jgi:hypothetical protein